MLITHEAEVVRAVDVRPVPLRWQIRPRQVLVRQRRRDAFILRDLKLNLRRPACLVRRGTERRSSRENRKAEGERDHHHHRASRCVHVRCSRSLQSTCTPVPGTVQPVPNPGGSTLM